MRRRCEKLDPDALPLLPWIALVDDPAFQLFLCLRVAKDQHLPILDFMLQKQQTAVGIDDHGFTSLAEFAAILAAPLRLHAHFMKDPPAAPRACGCNFAHIAIFQWQTRSVNWPAVQVFPIRNLASDEDASPEQAQLVEGPLRSLLSLALMRDCC